VASSAASGEAPVNEWRANWPLLLSCLAGLSTSTLAVYALGQFMAPLEREFGWTRTEVSAGLSVSLILSFLATPLVGRLVDKVNARLLALPGLVVVGVALFGFSFATHSLALWIALWSFHAVASALIGPTIWPAVVSGAFNRHRSLAIVVAICGTNVATAFAPAVARVLVDDFGWRMAFRLLGLFWVGPALLLVFFFFIDRRERSAPAPVEQDSGGAPRAALSRIFLSPSFFRLALAVIISSMAMSAYTIHLAPALVAKGLDATAAATVAGVAGLASVPGKLATGWLFDRLGTGRVAALNMALLGLASALFAIHSDGLAPAIAASALLGVSAGANFALFSVTTASLFSVTVFGVVYGTLISLTALCAAVGPLAISAVYDASGSYAPAFWAGLGIALVSALLMQRLSPVSIEG